MRRRLDFDALPPPWVPLRFLLTAPWFGMAAGLLLAWSGPHALASRWSPATLALTHLLTLGVLTMTMLGALLQMLPVVAGLRPGGPGWAPAALWLALCGGTLGLAAGLGLSSPAWLGAGGALLACALVLALLTAGRALAGQADQAALAMAKGMRAALVALVLAGSAGLALVAALSGRLALDVLAVVDAHAALGLAGWVGMLVLAAALQVLPMFQSAQPYHEGFARTAPALALLGLVVWSGTRLYGMPGGWVAGAMTAGVLAWFAGATLRALRSRKRSPDTLTRSWQLALAALLAACALWAWPGEVPHKEWLLGVLFIGGFALTIVNGMLYKIVGFLLWYHQQAGGADPATVIKIGQLLPDSRARRQLLLHGAAVAALLAALLAWPLAARWSGVLLFLSQGLAACDFLRAWWRVRAALGTGLAR
jgi:hypothetical protein